MKPEFSAVPKEEYQSPSYYYQGYCPFTGELLRLPRTAQIEAIARELMRQLAEDESYSQEGKMYGVLLVELPNGTQQVLKAFSGLLNGKSEVKEWISPIPGRERVALAEAQTLAQLHEIKQELLNLKQLPQRQEYQKRQDQFKFEWQEIKSRHQGGKQQRHSQRQQLSETLTGESLVLALESLNEASRQEGMEQRNFKRQRDEILQPLQQQIQQADSRIRELKQQRKALSRQLQSQMHAVYTLTNFSGQSLSLQELMPKGLPTGTGDCCAPKLLHYAATHNLKPLAMAEFWWGSTTEDKVSGQFYAACAERCQPIMGFMLSGLSSFPTKKDPSLSTLPVSSHLRLNSYKKVREKSQKEAGVERQLCWRDLFERNLYSSQTPSVLKDGASILDGEGMKDIPPASCPLPPAFRGRSLGEFGKPLSFLLPSASCLLPCLKESATHQTDILSIVYEDEWLIVVNKPPGLLSVPGRYDYDSVLSRLQLQFPNESSLQAVHRLDQDTSGILLVAKNLDSYRQLSQQFQHRQVKKVYEAILAGLVTVETGTIDLPLWGNPENRPYQEVNETQGKPSLTRFQVMKKEANKTRIQFLPVTGRTHQLRVHAAQGLGVPILGDSLYGSANDTSRLHLHARDLTFQHPQTQERLHLHIQTPF